MEKSIQHWVRKLRWAILFGFIPLVTLIMHFHVFSLDLRGVHVWRQTETQSTIDNFFEEEFNILKPRINGRRDIAGIYRREFPLMQWLIALLYHLTGSSILVTRISMFMFGLGIIWGAYFLSAEVFKDAFAGLVAAWAATFSPVVYYYMLNPLPDVFALMLTFWAMYSYFKWRKSKFSWGWIVLTGLLAGASTAVKLPYILFSCAIGLDMLILLFSRGERKKVLGAISILTLLHIPALAWYAWVIPGWNAPVTHGLFGGEEFTWGLLWEYFRGNAFTIFPNVILNKVNVPIFAFGIILIFKNKVWKKEGITVFLSLGLAIIAYLLFELNNIGVYHDYYLLPLVPLNVLLIAYGYREIMNWKKKLLYLIPLIGLVLLPIYAAKEINLRWDRDHLEFNADLMDHKSELRSAVPDDSRVLVMNDDSAYIWFYYVHKKGWSKTNDHLDPEQLTDMIERGMSFVYSDSRVVDESDWFQAFVVKDLGQYGSIHVFEVEKPDSE